MSSLPFPEERTADANDRGAFLHGEVVVVGHTHGKGRPKSRPTSPTAIGARPQFAKGLP